MKFLVLITFTILNISAIVLFFLSFKLYKAGPAKRQQICDIFTAGKCDWEKIKILLN